MSFIAGGTQQSVKTTPEDAGYKASEILGTAVRSAHHITPHCEGWGWATPHRGSESLVPGAS